MHSKKGSAQPRHRFAAPGEEGSPDTPLWLTLPACCLPAGSALRWASTGLWLPWWLSPDRHLARIMNFPNNNARPKTELQPASRPAICCPQEVIGSVPVYTYLFTGLEQIPAVSCPVHGLCPCFLITCFSAP